MPQANKGYPLSTVAICGGELVGIFFIWQINLIFQGLLKEDWFNILLRKPLVRQCVQIDRKPFIARDEKARAMYVEVLTH